MADTKTESLTEVNAAEETCCEPVCGPDICGASVQVLWIEKPKVRQETARAADQCCDPARGPETCGCLAPQDRREASQDGWPTVVLG